jgi:lysophospholipase
MSSATSLRIDYAQVAAGRLRCAFAHADGRRPAIMLLPGRGEFIEKYEATVEALRRAGFASYLLDWRGQGGSLRLIPGSARGHIDRFSDYLEDLDAVLDRFDALGLEPPVAMVAHSMGGHVGLRYLRERPHPFRAAVMMAPMFDIELGPLPRPVVELLAEVAARSGAAHRYVFGHRDPDLSRCAFANNPLTSCPDSYEAWLELLRRHPDHMLGGVTFGWLAAALRSIAVTRRRGYLETIRVPMLILSAEAERIVCNRAQASFARRLPRAILEKIPAARHDLLWELAATRSRLMSRLGAFLAEQLRPAEPPAPAAQRAPAAP